MNKTISIYLDLIRFLAAVVIFIVHANNYRFTGGLPFFWRFSHLGNDVVMVFFVLSGFVIAYVANSKEKTIDNYFISRFSRLYSVVVPALILTMVLDFFGSRIAYELYDGWWYVTSYPIGRFLANLFFVNELWFFSIRPFSNGPFWSIGYEFWYYVLFAITFYLKNAIKYVLLIMVSLLIGPKILILMPVWIMGVLVYKVTLSEKISEFLGWIFLFVSVFGYIVYRANGGQEYILDYTKHMLGIELYENLSWSKYFMSSYIIGMFVSLNFIGFASVSHRFEKIFNLFSVPIRYFASYTFILYLLHYPLLQFFSALTFNQETSQTIPVVVIIGTLLTVWSIGGITEKQKSNYKYFFTTIWRYVYSRLTAISNTSGNNT